MESQTKGKILYEPEWSKKRRFKDPINIVLGIIVMILGVMLEFIFLGSVLIWGNLTQDNVAGLLMGFFIGTFVIFLGFILLKQEASSMPFRIYESGLTKPKVPFKQGLKRIETFIPWSSVEFVEITSAPFYTAQIKGIRIRYDNNEMELYYNELEKPFTIMRFLHKYIPEKMSPQFSTYIGSTEERYLVKPPIDLYKNTRSRFFMLLFMIPFLSVMAGAFLFPFTTASVFILVLFSGMIAMFSYMFYSGLKDEFKSAVNSCKPVRGGIKLKLNFSLKYLCEVPEFISFNEIKWVRLELDPLFFSHCSEIEMADGSRNRARIEVYFHALAEKEFVLKDMDLYNKRPRADGKIFRPSPMKFAAFILLLSLPFAALIPLLGLIVGGNSAYSSVPDYFQGALKLMIIIIIPIWIYLMKRISSRSRIATDMSADDKGIIMPNAPEKFRYIRREDFITAMVDKDYIGYYCDIITRFGRLRASQLARDRLKEAGYPVQDRLEAEISDAEILDSVKDKLPFNLAAPTGKKSVPFEQPVTKLAEKITSVGEGTRKLSQTRWDDRIRMEAGWNGVLFPRIPPKLMGKLRLYTFGGGSAVLLMGLVSTPFMMPLGVLLLALGIVFEYAARKTELNGVAIDFPENMTEIVKNTILSYLREKGMTITRFQQGSIIKGEAWRINENDVILTFFRMRGQQRPILRLRIGNVSEKNIQEAISIHLDLDNLFLERGFRGIGLTAGKSCEYRIRDDGTYEGIFVSR